MPHHTAPSRCRTALIAGGLCAFLAVPALAERADRNLPMNVEADAMRHDDVQQTSVFTGNVVITKGTIVIRGQRVEVKQDEQGNQFGVVLAANDKPAFFRQKRDGADEYIEGEGQRIDYNGQADTVKFTGQAVMRRYKGSKLNDETRGGVIFYDNKSEVYTVDGNQQRSAENPSGRVRTMLTPTAKPDAATKPGPTGPQPVLSPSTGLEKRP
jgi:lipopolysaccharide export system protein LptA